jgi:hypothetical protein
MGRTCLSGVRGADLIHQPGRGCGTKPRNRKGCASGHEGSAPPYRTRYRRECAAGSEVDEARDSVSRGGRAVSGVPPATLSSILMTEGIAFTSPLVQKRRRFVSETQEQ